MSYNAVPKSKHMCMFVPFYLQLCHMYNSCQLFAILPIALHQVQQLSIICMCMFLLRPFCDGGLNLTLSTRSTIFASIKIYSIILSTVVLVQLSYNKVNSYVSSICQQECHYYNIRVYIFKLFLKVQFKYCYFMSCIPMLMIQTK